MGLDTIPMRTFLDTQAKWLQAIEGRKTEDARFLLKQLQVAGKMLAIDPEFQRLFAEHNDNCSEMNAESVLNCVYAFYQTITDAGQEGRYRARGSPSSRARP